MIKFIVRRFVGFMHARQIKCLGCIFTFNIVNIWNSHHDVAFWHSVVEFRLFYDSFAFPAVALRIVFSMRYTRIV